MLPPEVGHNCGITEENACDEFGLMHEGLHFTKKGGEMIGKAITDYLLEHDY